MSGDDGFLARWSRRKLGPAPEGEKAADPPVAAEPPARQDEGDPAEPTGPVAPVDGAAELTVAEIAALPRIEELTAETGLAEFLRDGVPLLLRKAALRKVWTLDPAIRDFVGEARDYAYDWNVAGGVPGSGPLLPSHDAAARIEDMFSRPYKSPDGDSVCATAPDAIESEAADTPILTEGASSHLDRRAAETGDVAPRHGAAPAEELRLDARTLPPAEPALPPVDRGGESDGNPIRRRHGSAMPT